MPNDGKGQGSGEGSGPDPNPDPVPKTDPAVGPEEKAVPHHVICMPPVEEEEKVCVASASTAAAKKGCLSRSDSCHEECRICQQPREEPLIVLGCKCRGELAKAHRSCIDVWFHTKGSNKCEICLQVAANVSPPESQPSSNYWVWRVDSAGWTNFGRGNRERPALGRICHSNWRTSTGCADIDLSWCFSTTCEHYNRCAHCAGTRDGIQACIGMLPSVGFKEKCASADCRSKHKSRFSSCFVNKNADTASWPSLWVCCFFLCQVSVITAMVVKFADVVRFRVMFSAGDLSVFRCR